MYRHYEFPSIGSTPSLLRPPKRHAWWVLNRRYLRWAEAIDDGGGISHAHMCLAHVYEAMGEEEVASGHRSTSLDGCRQRGDIENPGKVSFTWNSMRDIYVGAGVSNAQHLLHLINMLFQRSTHLRSLACSLPPSSTVFVRVAPSLVRHD